jgi:hypothetical protein
MLPNDTLNTLSCLAVVSVNVLVLFSVFNVKTTTSVGELFLNDMRLTGNSINGVYVLFNKNPVNEDETFVKEIKSIVLKVIKKLVFLVLNYFTSFFFYSDANCFICSVLNISFPCVRK